MSEEKYPATSSKLIQSYLFTKEFGNFFVSTCYRMSSAMVDPAPWYYETYAWKLDKDRHRTDWVVEFGGVDDIDCAFDEHIEICRQLELKGKFEEEE